MIIFVILIVAVAILFCGNIGLWMWGVRPYLHRQGRTCVTAANWGYSIWADLTTAYEIGKEQGYFPLCVKLLFALQVFQVLFFTSLLLIGLME